MRTSANLAQCNFEKIGRNFGHRKGHFSFLTGLLEAAVVLDNYNISSTAYLFSKALSH